MRFPTLHGGQIVFEAHGNLWEVAREGGIARRLTANAGMDWMPRFSPDGRWIAFTGDYQGNLDVYVMPAQGGQPRRLTFWSDVVPDAPLRWGPNNMVVNWTPDSKNIVFLSRRNSWNAWYGTLFEVGVEGGLPRELPLDRGGLLSYAPDGHRIAYNRIFRNFRTWKRYDGGLSQHIDIYDFDSRQLRPVTDWSGTATSPMWYRNTIYFLSDHDAARRRNIWAYDVGSGQFRQVTHFTDYDIDFPGLGDDGIVFQQGGALYLMDLPSEQLHRLRVQVPDDGVHTAPRYIDVGRYIRDPDTAQMLNYDLSPNGKRALLSARGDIFSVPEQYGNTRNLTHDSNADEDHPSWSPDGTQVAYTSDASGEQQIAVRAAEGGAERTLTHFASGYFYRPVWAPGGHEIAFSDGEHRLWYVPVNGGSPVQVAQDTYQEIHDYAWSPDGRWLAYSITNATQQRQIWLYELATHRATRISQPGYDDFQPAFDANGTHLYFVSSRHVNPVVSEVEFDVANLKTTGIYVITLQIHEPSLFAPRSDEGALPPPPPPPALPPAPGANRRPPPRGDALGPDSSAADAAASSDTDTAAAQEADSSASAAAPTGAANPTPGCRMGAGYRSGAIAPIHIDFDGLMQRAVPVPIPAATLAQFNLRCNDLYYQTLPPSTFAGPLVEEKSELHLYDLAQRRDSLLFDGLSSYQVSADGSKLMFRRDGAGGKAYYIIDAGSGAARAAGSAKPLDGSHMQTLIDPRQEWTEMFNSAWRLQRDLFVRQELNGVNWDAVHRSYGRLLPLLGSREDLNYLIGEVIGELSNSHTYVGGGDRDLPQPRVPTAWLGADFGTDARTGRYVFTRIYQGDNTRQGYRSPLTEPGIAVPNGAQLLAIDGEPVRVGTDPSSLLVGKQNQTIRLTIADTAASKPRDVLVTPLPNELALRSRAWIDHNRELVDKASGGRIGYVYLSDMEELGMEQFIEQFYGQLDRPALIVDDRYNGGGNVDQIVLERVRRVLVGMSTNREHAAQTIPQQLVTGPKVCLINEYSASDGDLFAALLPRVPPRTADRHAHLGRGARDPWQLAAAGRWLHHDSRGRRIWAGLALGDRESWRGTGYAGTDFARRIAGGRGFAAQRRGDVPAQCSQAASRHAAACPTRVASVSVRGASVG